MDALERDMVLTGLSDYVGLWQFAKWVRDHHGARTPDERRTDVMDRVRRLLRQGWMVAGDLTPNGGFAPWPGSTEDVIDQIGQKWESRGWSDGGSDPNIGDMPWFNLTTAGQEMATELFWTIALAEQLEMCAKHGVDALPSPRTSIVGLGGPRAKLPLNGLRHPPTGDTSGWYLWWGELSAADDFFKPVHMEHLVAAAPSAVAFLALPAGWRFLRAANRTDVWYDAALLDV